MFYSKSRQDVVLYERVYKYPMKCNGTIMEIGALDGGLFSLSKFFEDHLGWTSILIQTNPYNFQKLSENQPHSIKYNTAVCRQKQTEFVISDAVGDVANNMTKKNRKGWNKDNLEKIVSRCTQLQHILKDVHYIDMFILDIEGGELEDWIGT